MSFAILIVWIIAAYKLNDFLVYRQNAKSGTLLSVGFVFAGLYFVAWLNGSPLFGNDGCFGSGITSTC